MNNKLILFAASLASAVPATSRAATVYFTFDDGPGPYSSEILDLFRDNGNGQATFFLVGQRVVQNPATIQRMRDEGHLLANHTYTHPNLTTLTESQLKDQLTSTQSVLGSNASTCFRPPGFATNASVEQWAKELDLRQVMATVNPQDWRYPNDSQRIYDFITANVFDGAVVVLHSEFHRWSVDALHRLLPELRRRGYEFRALPYCRNATLKVMALGDSITRGYGQDGSSYLASYRTKLDQNLRTGAFPSGFNWRWVGSTPDEPVIGFDHEGHSGATVEWIYANVTSWQARYRPDVILLHIGTENVRKGEAAAVTERRIATLLRRIRQNQPAVKVFVGRLVDVAKNVSTSEQQRNVALANLLGATVVNAGGASNNFYAVDFRDIGGEALYDKYHPNKFGYSKMAYRWYQALRGGRLPGSAAWGRVPDPYAQTTAEICHYNYTTRRKVCATERVNDGR